MVNNSHAECLPPHSAYVTSGEQTISYSWSRFYFVDSRWLYSELYYANKYLGKSMAVQNLAFTVQRDVII